MKLEEYSKKFFQFGIVRSKWNESVTTRLYKDVFNTLVNLGYFEKNIHSWDTMGSFELIYAADKICSNYRLDSLILIGNLLKGETEYFQYICKSLLEGIKNINIVYETPVILCILNYENKKNIKIGNRGIESAKTAVKMAFLKNILNN
ncbi:MAG TPA: 6,7-dimethyl-8-ribityllumazine synthase [Candidatus Angelobacter sp.]|jgi:6,7-dimethyl-8-ribityllumazine synthase|nr:6,7-dimethyl-8-ribityllumazine synthase [Candidatus Angelobacter sp.]